MSTDAQTATTGLQSKESLGRLRGLALGSALLLVFSFTFVVYDIIDVVGDPGFFLLVVGLTLLVATGLSRILSVRVAAPIGICILLVGLWSYATALPADFLASQDRIVSDLIALLTGLSVLRLQKIELWAIGFTPAPVFLTWYFAMRRRYVATVAVGGAALTFFVLTGDVDTTVALLGVVGAVGTIGFGRLERFGGDIATADVLAVTLAVMITLTLTVSVVPGGGAQPFRPFGGGGAGTVEANLLGTDQRLTIQGSIELSPKVRFTVEAEQPAYWRVAAYDRYTGTDWVRTGAQRPYDRTLPSPPGGGEQLTQRYEMKSRLASMPAAWRPVSISGEAENEASVTDMYGLNPQQPFTAGDSYRVVSRVPNPQPAELTVADDAYPGRIVERYTQLPASTPDRVEERTEQITDGADTAYETAQQIERWLENNREYSLDVERPDGNVADSFLFEMERGYCTYYATTMVTMLRSEGIPARFVVGYTPGEKVDSNRWVVRGLDSHAWVEVYFPDIGWVKFDPTPAGPRSSTENAQLNDAREDNEANVDTDETSVDRETPEPLTTPESITPREETPTVSETGRDIGELLPNESTQTRPTEQRTSNNGTGTPANTGGTIPFDVPSREQLALGLIVLVGTAAGARRTGVTTRCYRAVWVRWQPRADPETDVKRAFDRLEYVLGQAYRERNPGETPRQYLAAIDADERAERVCAHYERTRYAGDVTEEMATEAIELVNELVRDQL